MFCLIVTEREESSHEIQRLVKNGKWHQNSTEQTRVNI